MSASHSIIVACTLRFGSNLLCEWLEKYGYGRPTEFFQTERYQNVSSRRRGDAVGLPDIDAMHGSFAALHEGLRWRAVKWTWPQFRTFLDTIQSEGM